jgi:tellurite resistance protein TerC
MLTPEISALITGTSYKIPTGLSLGVIAAVLGVAVVASLVRTRRMGGHDSTLAANTLPSAGGEQQ